MQERIRGCHLLKTSSKHGAYFPYCRLTICSSTGTTHRIGLLGRSVQFRVLFQMAGKHIVDTQIIGSTQHKFRVAARARHDPYRTASHPIPSHIAATLAEPELPITCPPAGQGARPNILETAIDEVIDGTPPESRTRWLRVTDASSGARSRRRDSDLHPRAPSPFDWPPSVATCHAIDLPQGRNNGRSRTPHGFGFLGGR